jgi:hypothetical protein
LPIYCLAVAQTFQRHCRRMFRCGSPRESRSIQHQKVPKNEIIEQGSEERMTITDAKLNTNLPCAHGLQRKQCLVAQPP